MQRLLRITLMWLIVFAIPTQGIAAASMALCGPGHAAMLGSESSSAPRQHAHDAAHATEHDGSMASANGHLHHVAGSGLADPHGGLSPTWPAESLADLHQVSDLTCSVCAACCAALALPSDDSSFRATTAPPVFATSHRAGQESFFPSGLDRPPRYIRA